MRAIGLSLSSGDSPLSPHPPRVLSARLSSSGGESRSLRTDTTRPEEFLNTFLSTSSFLLFISTFFNPVELPSSSRRARPSTACARPIERRRRVQDSVYRFIQTKSRKRRERERERARSIPFHPLSRITTRSPRGLRSSPTLDAK